MWKLPVLRGHVRTPALPLQPMSPVLFICTVSCCVCRCPQGPSFPAMSTSCIIWKPHLSSCFRHLDLPPWRVFCPCVYLSPSCPYLAYHLYWLTISMCCATCQKRKDGFMNKRLEIPLLKAQSSHQMSTQSVHK